MMCDVRNARRYVNGREIRMDECMSGLVNFVDKNTPGFKTVACCCGHGKYAPTLLIKRESDGMVFDVFSGINITRLRNFYKMDEEGFYYIPEIHLEDE